MHVCILHIHNKYTHYIYYANKNFILDAINRLTAHTHTHTQTSTHTYIIYIYLLYYIYTHNPSKIIQYNNTVLYIQSFFYCIYTLGLL